MVTAERSVSAVLNDIFGNVQEIVRSEVRLAKTEIREEAIKAKSPARILGLGALTTAFAVLFVLLAIFFALTLVMPAWAAALTVGIALAAVAGVLLKAGARRFRLIRSGPEHTTGTLKENVPWAKQQVR